MFFIGFFYLGKFSFKCRLEGPSHHLAEPAAALAQPGDKAYIYLPKRGDNMHGF